jgi:hypothetical protein
MRIYFSQPAFQAFSVPNFPLYFRIEMHKVVPVTPTCLR